MTTQSIKYLLSWFETERRDLPWRKNPTPYRVWVSEIMLQQTRVSVVISYFNKWMKHFPTLKALANSSEEEVIKIWEGLGYYSRARNLRIGAKYILEHFNGELPSNTEDLKKIKGIGPYTLGAIQSFAFHQKQAAVDGNVIRVISRFLTCDLDMSKAKNVDIIREKTRSLLPNKKPWVVMEGLIELGAVVCKKRAPECGICPLRRDCRANKLKLVEDFPQNSKKVQYEKLYRVACIFRYQEKVLIKKVEDQVVMSGLYEFPFRELSEEEFTSRAISPKNHFEISGNYSVLELGQVAHSFTRYRVQIKPYLIDLDQKIELSDYIWVSQEKLYSLPFSSGHRRIIESNKIDVIIQPSF